MKPDNVSKEFAGLVGDCRHELYDVDNSNYYGWETPPYRAVSLICTCGYKISICSGVLAEQSIDSIENEYLYKRHEHKNPTYTIELIKARIQAVPCGECNGMGDVCEVNDQCKEDLPEHGICPTTGLPARCYDNTLDCTCTDGKRDDMPAFMVWLWSYCLVLAANNNTTVQFQFWNFLTTPALLMQAYIAYRRTV